MARRARGLALLGFAPFAVLSLWLAGIAPDHPWRDGTIVLLKTYAAVILSFLGGIRWGLAMRGGEGVARRDMAASIVPPLAGWAALFAPAPYAFALLAVAFAAMGAWDNLAVHRGAAPAWFGRMRALLTLLVVTAMVVAFAGAARGAGYPGASIAPETAKTRSEPSM